MHDCVIVGAGPEDKDPYIQWPVGFYRMTTSRSITRGYETAPLAHLDGRRMV